MSVHFLILIFSSGAVAYYVYFQHFTHSFSYFNDTDSLREGYNHLRGLVMAYGDISPQSPLSMMSSSQPTTQQSSTTVSTSERTTPLLPNDHRDDQTASPFVEGSQSQPAQAHSVPRSWSRSQSQQSRSAPSSRPVSGMDKSRNHTPVSMINNTYIHNIICSHAIT